MIITRWTGAVTASNDGGFVAYGDWLQLKAERDAALAQVAALRDVLERVLKALDDEAKSESTLESAEANFSSTASDSRRYENALIETGNALKSARTILEATQ